MNRKAWVAAWLILALLPSTAYVAGMGMHGMDNTSMLRHRYAMHNGIGAEYAGRENPVTPSDENLLAGRELYQQNCVACHGESGRGDGPAASGMNPPPGNIAAVARTPMATDGYLYWTIAEGGIPLGTAMPAYKNALKEEQIWTLIRYLRTL